MLEQTPQFIPPSKEASHHVSLDRHPVEEAEPAVGMRKFDIIDSPAKEHQADTQHIETAQVTVETKGQPDSIEYSDQFASLAVSNNQAPTQPVSSEQDAQYQDEEPVATKPLNFQEVNEVGKRTGGKAARYPEPEHDAHMPPQIADGLNHQDYGMFDISKGADESEKVMSSGDN